MLRGILLLIVVFSFVVCSEIRQPAQLKTNNSTTHQSEVEKPLNLKLVWFAAIFGAIVTSIGIIVIPEIISSGNIPILLFVIVADMLLLSAIMHFFRIVGLFNT